MTDLHVSPMPTKVAEALWSGGVDANGMKPERQVSDGNGVPCRHCLDHVAAGDPYLVLSYRPFPDAQPYAEQGPVFLHATPCRSYAENRTLPARYIAGGAKIVRGYGPNDRIVYGTGRVVEPEDIAGYAAELLARDDIAYIHVRSSTNNCFAFRIDRPAPRP